MGSDRQAGGNQPKKENATAYGIKVDASHSFYPSRAVEVKGHEHDAMYQNFEFWGSRMNMRQGKPKGVNA